MSAAYQRFAPYRDASMDRWHRKTMLMTGSGALRGNLRALNQSLSSQVLLGGACIFDVPAIMPAVATGQKTRLTLPC